MAACCGVPPYTPDQLMEIVVTDTTVSTRVGTALARPRRLSPSEGFALAASARALLAVPGSDESGALSRALAKLDRALGGEEFAVELDAPALLPLVSEALDSRRRLAISYYSASTDRVTDREILPLRVFGSEGHWYVDAWCGTAGGVRRFRVDRIGSAEPARAEGPTGPGRRHEVPRSLPDRADGHSDRASNRSSLVPTLGRSACPSTRPPHGWSTRSPRRAAAIGRRSGGDRVLRGRGCLAGAPAPPAGPRCPGGGSTGVPLGWPPTPPPGSCGVTGTGRRAVAVPKSSGDGQVCCWRLGPPTDDRSPSMCRTKWRSWSRDGLGEVPLPAGQDAPRPGRRGGDRGLEG